MATAGPSVVARVPGFVLPDLHSHVASTCAEFARSGPRLFGHHHSIASWPASWHVHAGDVNVGAACQHNAQMAVATPHLGEGFSRMLHPPIAMVVVVVSSAFVVSSGSRRRSRHAPPAIAVVSCRANSVAGGSASDRIVVTEASAADVVAASRFAVRSLRWTKEPNLPQLSEADYAFLEDRETKTYQDIYLSPDRGPVKSVLLVAKIDSEVIGCVGCEVKCYRTRADGWEIGATTFETVVDGEDKLHGDRSAVLRPVMSDLAVDQAYRLCGVASALISYLEELVRSWGYNNLALFVEQSNSIAVGIYQRKGYATESANIDTPTNYLEIDGERRIATRQTMSLLMSKSLTPEEISWNLYFGVTGVVAIAIVIAIIADMNSGPISTRSSSLSFSSLSTSAFS